MGLDIYVHELVKPTEEMKAKALPSEKIMEKFPNATLTQYDDIRVEPPDFPKEYLFRAVFHYTSFEKLFEKNSTPERPLKWGPEWHWGGEGSSPWGDDEEKDKTAAPDCRWWLYFYRTEPDKPRDPVEHICLPAEPKFTEDCTIDEEHTCFLYDNEELGYMRKGANGKFYDDMYNDKTKSNWVFSKEILDQYAKDYFDEDDEYYGNARASFHELIQLPFGDGKGKMVWFWH
jgi:hypothetical protein